MARPVQYRPNRHDVQAFFNSGQLYRAVERVALDGKTYAESIAPVGETEDYKSSFQVNRTEVEVSGKPRAAAKLENTSGHAAPVEWGYKGRAGRPGQSKHRVLGRTLEHLRH
jgi:hypothetical protein